MNIFWEDLSKINDVEFIEWNRLRETTFFVTGATGLIGTAIVKALAFVNKKRNLGLRIIALVRNEEKARARFFACQEDVSLEFLVGSIESFDYNEVEGKIDYIIHGASQTASKEFVQHPVETIDTALSGTKNILELAKIKNIQSLVYLSSMEVYGYPQKGHKVKEKEIGTFSPLNLRNSYPLSKVICENMCSAYAEEYDIPVRICRLTQTFGPGVSQNDNRIFAYFGRCINNKENIVLKTKGETERCYLYTADAVTAILVILLHGKKGEAYNAGNEDSYCSISEMAHRIAEANGIDVEYDLQPASANGYPETLYMDLDTSKLKGLGWNPIGGGYTIVEMIGRMVKGGYE